MTRSAPRLASSRAVSLPIPREEPVMRTTLASRGTGEIGMLLMMMFALGKMSWEETEEMLLSIKIRLMEQYLNCRLGQRYAMNSKDWSSWLTRTEII